MTSTITVAGFRTCPYHRQAVAKAGELAKAGAVRRVQKCTCTDDCPDAFGTAIRDARARWGSVCGMACIASLCTGCGSPRGYVQ